MKGLVVFMMTLDEAQQRLQDARAYLHIDRAQELSDLDKQIALPDFWNNTEHAQQVSKQASALRDIIDRYQAACALLMTFKLLRSSLKMTQNLPKNWKAILLS